MTCPLGGRDRGGSLLNKALELLYIVCVRSSSSCSAIRSQARGYYWYVGSKTVAQTYNSIWPSYGLGFALPILGQIRWCVESWFISHGLYHHSRWTRVISPSPPWPTSWMSPSESCRHASLSLDLIFKFPPLTFKMSTSRGQCQSSFLFPRSSLERKGQLRLQYLR